MSFQHCEHWKGGYILPGQPKGEIRDSTYFTAAPANTGTATDSESGLDSDSDSDSDKKAIVLLTDIFGLPLVNSKIMADRFAESVGVDVWVPDQFGGWPIVEVSELDDKLPQRPGEKLSFVTKLGFIWLFFKRIPRLFHSRPSAVDQRIHPFIQKLREEKGYTRIGAVGYCFGGGTTIRLASTDLINSAVVAHPGAFKGNLISRMKVPTSWQCAEEDSSFGPKLRSEAEAIFAERKDKSDFVDYEFHDYKGTVHGFAIRPNLNIPESKEGYEKSFESTVNWFKKTL